MPTNRTKRTRARAGSLDHWKVDQLATGQCLIAGVGYGRGIPRGCNHYTEDDRAAIRAAMEADWHLHSAAFMAWWRGETEQFTDKYTSREKLKGWIGQHGAAEPYALREFGGPR